MNTTRRKLNETPFADGEGCGQFVLSFDLELGWGSIENGSWRTFENAEYFRASRDSLKKMLKAMDEFEIQATWGVVGGLAATPSNHDFSHLPSSLRDRTLQAIREGREDTFDGRDLVDQIQSTRVEHTFCSHTYSHARFSHPEMDAATVECDLNLFHDQLPKELRFSPTLIFPQNHEAFLPTVKAAGFTNCRGAAREGGPASRSKIQKIADLFNVPPESRIDEPIPGLARETDSLLFNTGRRPWKRPLVLRRAMRGLKSITESHGIFHVWSHPFDLACDPPLIDGFVTLLREVAELRNQDRLLVRDF